MLMKIIGLVGSPRIEGNTSILVKKALDGAEFEGASVDLVQLSALDFQGCTGCEGCKNSFRCVIKDDMQKLYDSLEEADGIILGSPTYFYNITSITKKFIERLYCYDTFDALDRSVWINKFEKTGTKYAVTIAVCEQNDIEDMGVTSLVIDKSLQAVGYRIVKSLKILHVFKKGEIVKQIDSIDEAFEAGKKIAKTIKLNQTVNC